MTIRPLSELRVPPLPPPSSRAALKTGMTDDAIKVTPTSSAPVRCSSAAPASAAGGDFFKLLFSA